MKKDKDMARYVIFKMARILRSVYLIT